MLREDLIVVDEDGYSLGTFAAAWNRIRSEAEERIYLLGYEGEIEISDVVDELF